MKGVIPSVDPAASIVGIPRDSNPLDIEGAAFLIYSACRCFCMGMADAEVQPARNFGR